MKKSIFYLTLILLIFSACTSGSQEAAKNEKSSIEINPENLISAQFDVQGMTCTGCENSVKEGVNSLNGIAEVKASFLDGTVIVQYDTSQVNIGEIQAEIIRKGYKVPGYNAPGSN